MSRAIRIVACLLAVGLLAAPVARACCELGPTKAPCAMDARDEVSGGHAMGTMPPKAAPMHIARGDSTAPVPCHGDRRLSAECCEPAPAPVQALGKPAGPRELPTELAVAALATSTPPAAPAAAVPAAPPRSARLHDLGRYTLFSSLLL